MDPTNSSGMLTAEARRFPFTLPGTFLPPCCERSLGTSALPSKNFWDADNQQPNNTMQLSVCVVTPRAYARVAPTHPAADRERWTDRSQDGTVSSLGVPERTDRDGARREGVVEVRRSTAEVEATQTRDSRLGIQGPSPWHPREKADSLFNLVCEDLFGSWDAQQYLQAGGVEAMSKP